MKSKRKVAYRLLSIEARTSDTLEPTENQGPLPHTGAEEQTGFDSVDTRLTRRLISR